MVLWGWFVLLLVRFVGGFVGNVGLLLWVVENLFC